MVEGMVERFRKELGLPMKVIATGGLAPIIAQETDVIDPQPDQVRWVVVNRRAGPDVFDERAIRFRIAAERREVRSAAGPAFDHHRCARVAAGLAYAASPAGLPVIGALVVEEGGALCHAAIVAREFGLAAVIGAHRATTRIPHGAHVEVDPKRGTVRLL